MADNDVRYDPWWRRIATTLAYLIALAALIGVSVTGVDLPTDGPIIEALRSLGD